MKFKSWTPLSSDGKEPLALLQRGINQLFETILKEAPSPTLFSNQDFIIQPKIDISETENEYIVTAEMPGVDKKGISLELRDNVLLIRAEKSLDRSEKDKDYHLTERISGSFFRSLELPYAVDFSKSQANFENGILTVHLPKTKEEKTKIHQINVS